MTMMMMKNKEQKGMYFISILKVIITIIGRGSGKFLDFDFNCVWVEVKSLKL